MRKIDLKPYFLGEEGQGEVDVKKSIVTIMFNPALKLNARDAIAQDALAKRIEEADGEILLEESEYNRLKTAVEAITGYGRGDIPLIQRILDAPEVQVKEA